MNDLMKHLAAHVSKQPDFKPAERVYVSVYQTSQCYGGPEEGGWWYDRTEFKGAKHFVSREEAEAWMEHAKREIEKRNKADAPARHRAMASLPDDDAMPCPANCPEGYIPKDWNDGGKLVVVIEEELGHLDNMNEPTPHYE